jgi:two-component system, chemotaxis family, protein-glutamate methylesterase/glutaminase
VEALSNPTGDAVRQRDLVVIGASAGGVEALQELVSGLPPEFPAPVLIVMHISARSTSVLPQILSRRGQLPANFARDGDELLRGQIYVAPSDQHMLVHDGHIRLTRGPRENGHRPAIDPFFRSAARDADGRCIGVILSGLLDDGAAGLRFVQQHGGATIIQDPEEALFPSMPRAALGLMAPDRIVSAAEVARTLCELIEEAPPTQAPPPPGPPDADESGRDRVEIEDPSETAALLAGPPSALTCPECGGALWEVDEGGTARFACHVGHAYSLASLVEEQGRSLEMVLWAAVRALEERADVHRRLASRTETRRSSAYEDRALEAERHATALREMLTEVGRIPAPSPEGE